MTITSLGGTTPVQGEGTLADGQSFFFRARHEAWAMSVGPTVDAAIDEPTWTWSEP